MRFVVAVIVVAGLVAALVYSQWRPEPLRVSGFIESHEIRVGSRVGGRVAEVMVEEGQQVEAGQPLVRLEPFDLQQHRARAEATLRQRQEELGKLRAGYRPEEITAADAVVDQRKAALDKLVAGPRKEEIDAARAQVTLAKAELERAQQQFNRVEALVRSRTATQDDFDEVDKQLKVARARVDVAQNDLTVLEEGSRAEDIAAARASLAQVEAESTLKSNGYRSEEVAQAAAAVDAARADLDAIDRQIQELTITAPGKGVVEAIDLRPGDLLNPNAPAVALSDVTELWVRAYVPENRLNLRIGQTLPVTVDSFPAERFSGRISFIARQAEFTPGNVQTPEERSKQVFRIKVVLTSGRNVLRPGMSADVWLEPASSQPLPAVEDTP